MKIIVEQHVCHPREGGDPVQLNVLDSRFRGNDNSCIKKILALSFSFALCIFSFALSALAESNGLVLQYRPKNIAKGYHVVSFIENNGVKEKKDQRFDLPIIRSSETAETVETTGTAETLDFGAIMARGIPLHLPGAAVSANSTWDGWSEVDTLIIHHVYTFGNIKEIAGRKCAEIGYKLQATQRSHDDGSLPDQSVITGEGRFLFDLNNGVIVVHTWQLNGGGLKADYAAVLNM